MAIQIIAHGGDSSTWHVHGPNSGAEGVSMGKDQVKGLFAAPVRTAWKSGARQIGGRPKARWYDPRDLSLGFHIVAARVTAADQETIMSQFRQAFDYREDDWDHDAVLPRLQVITDRSDRSLDVQLHAHPDMDPGIDPLVSGHANPVLPLRAGMPFYYETPVTTSWSTASSSGSGNITVSNPTDLPMMHKWVLTRGNWTLPDRSWEGPKHHRRPGVSKLTGRDDSTRAIVMPTIGVVQGGATVDLDPDELMVRDAHDTNLLGQMPVPGRYFEYVIPPWTQEQTLPVSVTGAPAGGAMVQLIQPRYWSEPIGGQ